MMKRNVITAIALSLLLGVTSQVRAEIIDLTTKWSSDTINGAQFIWTDFESTGTGVIDSFVRVHGDGKDADTLENGYNTDSQDFEFDEVGGGFTHSITISNIPTLNIDGTVYREFLLDINQNKGGSNELLSLDKIEIYLGSSGSLTYAELGDPIWELDTAAEDNYVKMDASLNPGSGKGDVFVYIPDSLFVGDLETTYVYLYSEFGLNYGFNGGFEEWAVRIGEPDTPVVPVPGAVLLGFLGIVVAGIKLRKSA